MFVGLVSRLVLQVDRSFQATNHQAQQVRLDRSIPHSLLPLLLQLGKLLHENLPLHPSHSLLLQHSDQAFLARVDEREEAVDRAEALGVEERGKGR